MIKLRLTKPGGATEETLAQVLPAHRHSKDWKAIHIDGGRSFLLSPMGYEFLRTGHTINVLIGLPEEQELGEYYVQRLT